MFVEFTRAVDPVTAEFGEDDGMDTNLIAAPPSMLLVNPALVAGLFSAEGDAHVQIIKFADGRGFKVKGTYDEVKTTLMAQPH